MEYTGRYGVYGLAQCTGPCIPGCVWGAIKWLYGAAGELEPASTRAGGFGEWALYCDSPLVIVFGIVIVIILCIPGCVIV